MSQAVVAKRYAKALFELSSEQGQVDAVHEQLEAFVDLLEANDELTKFVESPNMSKQAKSELIQRVLVEDVSPLLFNTIRLLIDRDRVTMFPDLLHAYTSIANESLGRAKAIVTTSRALTDDDKQNIAAAFAKLTGKQIEVVAQVDERLLGGMRVRIGDRLYDGSLSGKLERLEKKLNESQAV